MTWRFLFVLVEMTTRHQGCLPQLRGSRLKLRPRSRRGPPAVFRFCRLLGPTAQSGGTPTLLPGLAAAIPRVGSAIGATVGGTVGAVLLTGYSDLFLRGPSTAPRRQARPRQRSARCSVAADRLSPAGVGSRSRERAAHGPDGRVTPACGCSGHVVLPRSVFACSRRCGDGARTGLRVCLDFSLRGGVARRCRACAGIRQGKRTHLRGEQAGGGEHGAPDRSGPDWAGALSI
jgi:hypothetical protein